MRRETKVVIGVAASVLVGQALTGGVQGRGNKAGVPGTPPARLHVSAEEIPWMHTNRYPEWFRKTYRYRELVGRISNWQDASAADWKGVPNAEIRMGVLHFDRGAIYPFHFHPAPELYYVIRGTAEWTVGTDTFVAKPGTAIHTPPNAHHRMVNIGDETLEVLYVWWAPGGDSKVLNVPSSMGEGWDRPKDATSDTTR